MNLTEYAIRKQYRYSKLNYVFDIYMECEYRANLTQKEFDGLQPGEFRFDYSSWENRLGYSHKQMVRAIKELTTKNIVIIQTFKGKKGACSKYFLSRFKEQKKEQNEEQNEEQNKHSKINSLESVEEQNREQKQEQKREHSSQYNNLNIISNNNNISKDILCSTEVQQVINRWNLLGLQNIKGIYSGTNRYKLFNARLKQYGINDILAAIDNIDKSSFLKGQNKKGWIITFDWFIKPNNFIKVLEGNFNNSIKKENDDKETKRKIFNTKLNY